MKESAFWAGVKAGLSPHMHLCRIENTAGSGISDVNVCKEGHEAWIELKVFKGNRLHFRNSQMDWVMTRNKYGGRVKVLARKNDEIFLWDAAHLLSKCVRAPHGTKAFSINPSGVAPRWRDRKPFDWFDLAGAIFDSSDQS